jgi:hypothetical protein
LQLECQHVKGGFERSNATDPSAGMKEMYLVVFEITHIRLLNVAIHNSMVMYQSLSKNKNIKSLKCRLSLPQGLVGKQFCSFSCTQPSINRISIQNTQRITFPRVHSCHHEENAWCVQNTRKGQSIVVFRWMFQDLQYKPQCLIQLRTPLILYAKLINLSFLRILGKNYYIPYSSKVIQNKLLSSKY